MVNVLHPGSVLWLGELLRAAGGGEGGLQDGDLEGVQEAGRQVASRQVPGSREEEGSRGKITGVPYFSSDRILWIITVDKAKILGYPVQKKRAKQWGIQMGNQFSLRKTAKRQLGETNI